MTSGEGPIDAYVLGAILALLAALVIVLGVAIHELIPNDRERR